MCICDADDSYDRSANYFDFRDGTTLANGMGCAFLWNNSACFGIRCLVIMERFSIFQMGKLTQSQKALFLWRSPLAKLQ